MDISEYDNQNYQDLRGKSDHTVLCKSHVASAEITDAVIDICMNLTNNQLASLAYS
jgi:hypothetical protein